MGRGRRLQKKTLEELDPDEPLFYFDTAQTGESVKAAQEPKRDKSAWIDEDDQMVSVDLLAMKRTRKLRHTVADEKLAGKDYESRLREQFGRLNPPPKWALQAEEKSALDTFDEQASDSDDNEQMDNQSWSNSILSRPFAMIKRKSSARLLPDVIDVQRLGSIRNSEASSSSVNTIEFHPSAAVLMSAGLDKTVRLFSVDGKENKLLQGLRVGDLPITCAHFTSQGDQIVATGRKPFFYIVDLAANRVDRVDRVRGRPETCWESFVASPCGRLLAFLGQDGCISLLSGKSKQSIATLKMNGRVRAAVFSPEGDQLYSVGSENSVYVWDTRTFKCIRKFSDDAGPVRTSLAISPDSSFFACGANSGVVNLYDSSAMDGSVQRPAPFKALMNLTTFVRTVKFHPSSELLAIGSDEKRNALRLIHLPSGRAFANWPTERSPLGRIRDMDFSPSGKHMALANEKGAILLYRLEHFINQ